MKKIILTLNVIFIISISNIFAQPSHNCTKGDCKNGYGTDTFEDGFEYIGQFKNEVPNGDGTLYYPDGGKYVGEFKDGKFHGKGTLNTMGVKYIGEFKNGLYEGKGVIIYSDGSKYAGGFLKGKFHGKGTFTEFLSKNISKGQWKNGTFCEGTMNLGNGSKFIGKLTIDGKVSSGTVFLEDGRKYTGGVGDWGYDLMPTWTGKCYNKKNKLVDCNEGDF